MFRLLKALPIMLAVAALSLIATGCGSNQAHIRVVNAIPNSDLDVDFNSTKVVSSISFGNVQPTTPPAQYLSVASGTVGIQAYVAGSTTSPIFGANPITSPLGGSNDYTVVLYGTLLGTNTATAFVVQDDNTAPTTGNVEFRVINASYTTPGSVDVYLIPPNTNIGGSVIPQISGLAQTQGSSYQSLTYPGTTGVSVVVTLHGSTTPLFPGVTYDPPTGAIFTVVLYDNESGNGMNPNPLVLQDID